MNKFLPLILSLVFVLNLNAQLDQNTIAPNFALEDINGNPHNLYDYLDAGKPVLLVAFNATDNISWAYTQALEVAYNEYGPDGDDSIVFLAIETTDVDDVELTDYSPFGDPWVEHISYPIINNSLGFANDFNIGLSSPVVQIIYPNRIANPVLGNGVFSDPVGFVSGYADPANYNNLEASGENNAGILTYTGVDNYCESFTPSFKIQNLGTQVLTSLTLVLLNNSSTLVQSIEWTGNVSPFQLEEIEFNVLNTTGEANLSLSITNPNGTSDEDPSNNTLTKTVSSVDNIGASDLNLVLNTDAFAFQTTWSIKNSLGATVYSSAPLENNNSYTETFTFTESGCYEFVIADGNSDGIGSGGSVTLSYDGNIIFNNAQFGVQAIVPFQVNLADTTDTTAPEASIEKFLNQDTGLLTITANTIGSSEIDSWSWDFGDGTTAVGQEAEHLYTENGEYTITLTIVGSNGVSNTVTEVVEVKVLPNSTFTISQTEGSDDVVTFTDESSFADFYIWNFGDGNNVSTVGTVEHTYAENGTYDVCLTVANAEFPGQGSESCQMVTVTNAFTGINDLKSIEEVNVINKENSLTLNFSTNQNIESLQINVFDLNGKLLYQDEISNLQVGTHQKDINTAAYPSGVYLINLGNTDGVVAKRFVR